VATVNTFCWNMKKRIVGFHLDEEQHWVAELECGHNQHVRHNPPWTIRRWVITQEGCDKALGHELNRKKCDFGARPDWAIRIEASDPFMFTSCPVIGDRPVLVPP